MTLQLTWVAGAAALSAALAACGSSSGLSQAGLIARSDAICNPATTRLHAIPLPATASEVPGYIKEVLPIFDSEVHALAKLTPSVPRAVKSQWNPFLADAESYTAFVGSLTTGGTITAQQAARLAQMGKTADAAATSLGANDCSGAAYDRTLKNFEAAYVPFLREYALLSQEVAVAFKFSSGTQASVVVARAAAASTAYGRLAQELAALRVPAPVQGYVSTLIAKLNAASSDINNFGRAVAAHDNQATLTTAESARGDLIATAAPVKAIDRQLGI